MRLVGSGQEQEFREELRKSNWSLFHENDHTRLLEAIQTVFLDMKTAYVIEWVPDQEEDTYGVLINTNIVAWIVLDRVNLDNKPIIQHSSVQEYKKKLKKIKQIQLLVALDLAATDVEDDQTPLN